MAQIQFKGKSIVWNHHLGVEYHELVPDKSKSLTDKVSLNDNLIIHDDNLKALKALLPTYAGKVKCIYIDPPYNTGEEGWAYSDNVTSPMMKEWLDKVVDKDDLTRHDKWLCMMTPRLKLLRELMTDEGIIFVSINDIELHHLRDLMDEVFGEENFISNFIWKKKSTSTNVEGVQVSSLVEYILCYGKSLSSKLLARVRLKETRSYSHRDEDGNYRLAIIEKKHAGSYKRDSMRFKILGQSPRAGKRWQIGEELAKELEKRGRLVIDGAIVKRKIYDFEDKDTYSAQPNLLDNHGTTDSAQKMLTDVFGEVEVFDNPKPPELIKHLITVTCNSSSIILDSFAGSGTTAQAILELNKEDDGNRKFILVEMEDDIADKITAERARRVIKGIPNAKDDNLKKGLGGTFSYFTLGDPIDEVGILSGKSLPSYEQMARYLFYTSTGGEFDDSVVDEAKNFIGKSKDYEVYLFYKPDTKYLKNTALNLDKAKALPAFSGKRRLVFAPAKYLDQEHLDKFQIDFAQLPYEIYKKG